MQRCTAAQSAFTQVISEKAQPLRVRFLEERNGRKPRQIEDGSELWYDVQHGDIASFTATEAGPDEARAQDAEDLTRTDRI